jgi:hypothetical protein
MVMAHCAAKLTFMGLCPVGFRWVSVSLYNWRNGLGLSSSYSFSMWSHLAIIGSWLPTCSDFNCTSCFRYRLRVHFRRWGRITYCCNILTVKSEERFPFGSTQQFQGLLFFPMYPARNNTKIITQSQYT